MNHIFKYLICRTVHDKNAPMGDGPAEGMIIIFPADRNHSVIYRGEKDRVDIGVNFYSLWPFMDPKVQLDN